MKLLTSLLALTILGSAWAMTSISDEPGKAQLVITGPTSDIEAPLYRLASSQAVFDELWTQHMGDRVTRAAQGWPLTPTIDFEACEALFVFGGDRTNSNGYRVMDVIDEKDAVTVRFEDISFQTSSLDGEDSGVAARPWAMILIPATDRTIFLEDNVQGLIGAEPKWKRRAAFPGVIGVGRSVGGTQQKAADK